MATTTNFGWETPDDTDLVKDGALAIRTLGSAIDTSLVDLKGGTTGQVLSKTSNTDMDFTWVTSDDANAIQNAIVDAKGDLIAASAADTPARLAVGNNGETLVANSSASTGLSWSPTFAAGKNCVINGGFDIWQRGTSFSNPASGSYTADRWVIGTAGSGTMTISQQALNGAISGSNSQFFYRAAISSLGTISYLNITQRIEKAFTLQGNTVSVSFWAKADTNRTINLYVYQFFGTGGSPSSTVTVVNGTAINLTSSWAKYTQTFSMPSTSGKTLGTNNNDLVELTFALPTGTTFTIDFADVQMEASATATGFTRSGGTLGGELAACQRYLPVVSALSNGNNGDVFCGYIYATNSGIVTIPFPTAARVRPTGITLSGTFQGFSRNTGYTVTPTFNQSTLAAGSVTFTTGFTGTAGEGCRLTINDGGYILFTGCEL